MSTAPVHFTYVNLFSSQRLIFGKGQNKSRQKLLICRNGYKRRKKPATSAQRRLKSAQNDPSYYAIKPSPRSIVSDEDNPPIPKPIHPDPAHPQKQTERCPLSKALPYNRRRIAAQDASSNPSLQKNISCVRKCDGLSVDASSTVSTDENSAEDIFTLACKSHP